MGREAQFDASPDQRQVAAWLRPHWQGLYLTTATLEATLRNGSGMTKGRPLPQQQLCLRQPRFAAMRIAYLSAIQNDIYAHR